MLSLVWTSDAASPQCPPNHLISKSQSKFSHVPEYATAEAELSSINRDKRFHKSPTRDLSKRQKLQASKIAAAAPAKLALYLSYEVSHMDDLNVDVVLPFFISRTCPISHPR